MNVLMVCHDWPDPHLKGNQILSFGVLKWIGSWASGIDLVIFSDLDPQQNENKEDWLRLNLNLNRVIVKKRNKAKGLSRWFYLFESYCRYGSLHFSQYRSPHDTEMFKKLTEETSYDYIWFDLLPVARRDPELVCKNTIVIGSDDYIEGCRLARTSSSKIFVKIRYLFLEWQWILVENSIFSKQDLTLWVVSRKSSKTIRHRHPDLTKVETIPIPIGTKFFEAGHSRLKQLKAVPNVFVCWCALDHAPNAEDFLIFIKRFWSKIVKYDAEAKLIVWSRLLHPMIRPVIVADNTISWIEYVEDPIILLKKCKYILFPQRGTGGCNVKLAQAVASGLIPICSKNSLDWAQPPFLVFADSEHFDMSFIEKVTDQVQVRDLVSKNLRSLEDWCSEFEVSARYEDALNHTQSRQ